MVRGEGIYLWDSEGNKILDGMSGLWCVNVGYGRTSIADAVYRQMRRCRSITASSTPPTCRR
jgi:putrescine aminotransferase